MMKTNAISINYSTFLGLFLVAICFQLPTNVLAQNNKSGENKEDNKIYKTSFMDTLQKMEEILDIRLEGDWVTMDTMRYTEDYQPARFKMSLINGDAWDLKLKVRPRGKFRRKICAFPPLKLNFSAKALEAAGLNGKFDKFKLVADCMLDPDGAGNDLVLREYLAYRIYNQIEPIKSFRAKLVRITFVDLPTGEERQSYGFILEDDKEIAERVNAEVCDCMNVNPDQLYPEYEAKIALFQYMIGNVDWSYQGMRNLKLFSYEERDTPNFFAVPYDFDYSGFVNAPYAAPVRQTGQLRLRERVYLGRLVENEALWEGLRPILVAKNQIGVLIEEADFLSRYSRNDIGGYVNSFFDEMYDILRQKENQFTTELPTPATLNGRLSRNFKNSTVSKD